MANILLAISSVKQWGINVGKFLASSHILGLLEIGIFYVNITVRLYLIQAYRKFSYKGLGG